METVELQGTTIHQTEDAAFIDIGNDKPDWIPLSCMEEWPATDETGDVIIHTWFAEKVGLNGSI